MGIKFPKFRKSCLISQKLFPAKKSGKLSLHEIRQTLHTQKFEISESW